MRAFLNSFAYAGKGIALAVKEERNMRLHLCVALYLYLFSWFYSFDRVEYALLTLCVVGVLAMELLNSALERAVHWPSPDKYRIAGVVKDMAAGAVLVFSAGAAVVGVLFFWDVAVFKQIIAFFARQPWWLLVLAASLAGCIWFVFFFGRRKEKG